MRVFLYEFVSGGGWWSWAPTSAPAGSLLREGAAMRGALAEDLLRVPGCQVVTTCDRRLAGTAPEGCQVVWVGSGAEERAALAELPRDADWTLLIAPEFDAQLADRCRRVERAGGRLLGPDSPLVELAADKHRTAQWLAAAGLPAPVGQLLAPGEPFPADFPLPAVVKPRDGAGSLGVRLVAEWPVALPAEAVAGWRRLERWYPGQAASVTLLGGPRGTRLLEPCGQRLSADGQLSYLGGWTPLKEPLADRARALAGRLARRLPPFRGWLGADLVLGTAGDASDVIIELNPRLTTSYLGLRRLARGNLAAALLAVAAGHESELSFGHERVEFAAGAVPAGPAAADAAPP
jgi:hypothetical protein